MTAPEIDPQLLCDQLKNQLVQTEQMIFNLRVDIAERDALIQRLQGMQQTQSTTEQPA